jgi:hypothetical protein
VTCCAHEVGGCWRSDQNRAAGLGLNQTDATKDERTHDTLTELRFGDEQPAQIFGRNHERLDVAFCVAVDQSGASGQRSYFSQELPGTLISDGRDVPQAVALRDGHVPAEDDEHAPDVAGLGQALPVAVAADRSESSQTRYFLRRQDRKHLIVA